MDFYKMWQAHYFIFTFSVVGSAVEATPVSHSYMYKYQLVTQIMISVSLQSFAITGNNLTVMTILYVNN
ncbi:hypothetical protein EB796_012388 [Bugula neritina]|uniref:Uncharacterized protein n=1 Tax=Bugula neritina TaxID=10212 RepID=A0A7J7JSJ0_BUGNE|nr:hypothetical protein EB796_012388 [Bugula neritina]